jgi:predicted phage terminase large subunit-like protein
MSDDKLTRAVVDDVQRRDFYAFFERAFEVLHPGSALDAAWHLKAVCHQCVGVAEGRTKRLLITLPPRHLKSVIVSVAFVAWQLGLHPDIKVMVISYGGELIAEHGAQFRRLVSSQWYRRLFPKMEVVRDTDELVTTTAGGYRRATTIRGAQTGLGADLIILDDPMKAQEARSPNERDVVLYNFQASILTRLNDKKTDPIICVAQRLHEDDLPGALIQSGQWRHLNLPAIAMEEGEHQIGGGKVHRRRTGEVLCVAREDRATLDAIRADMGNGNFEAQYQQNPGICDDAQLRWEEVHFYDDMPDRHDFERVVQSIDTGQTSNPTSDYSVCMTFGFKHPHWYLLDVIRGQWMFPDLERQVEGAMSKWQPDKVIIEQGGSGTPLAQRLRQKRQIAAARGYRLGCEVELIIPRGDKPDRFATNLGKVKEGVVLFPREGRFLACLKDELTRFPGGRNDDQVDALSQFLLWEFRRGFERNRLLGLPLGVTIRRNVLRREAARRVVVRHDVTRR